MKPRHWLPLIALPGCLLLGGSASGQDLRADEEIRASLARQQETGFGDLVADALRSAARAEIAWVAGGEFREGSLRAGGLAPSEAVSILDDPDDPIVLVTLNGATIREALELSLQQYPKPGKNYLHVSGMKVVFTPGPNGTRRVLSVHVQDQPLAAERAYRVAMSRSLALGSFGFFRLWPQARTAKPVNVSIGEALLRGMAAGPLRIRGDGRMAARME